MGYCTPVCATDSQITPRPDLSVCSAPVKSYWEQRLVLIWSLSLSLAADRACWAWFSTALRLASHVPGQSAGDTLSNHNGSILHTLGTRSINNCSGQWWIGASYVQLEGTAMLASVVLGPHANASQLCSVSPGNRREHSGVGLCGGWGGWGNEELLSMALPPPRVVSGGLHPPQSSSKAGPSVPARGFGTDMGRLLPQGGWAETGQAWWGVGVKELCVQERGLMHPAPHQALTAFTLSLGDSNPLSQKSGPLKASPLPQS